MKLIVEEMLQGIKSQLQKPAIVRAGGPTTEFGYMNDLRNELRACLLNNEIDASIADTGWLSFIAQLVKVLEEQPIFRPHLEIESIRFKPAAEKCVTFVVTFTNPINGYDYYEYGNAF